MNYDESKAKPKKAKAPEPMKLKDETSWVDHIDSAFLLFGVAIAIIIVLLFVTKPDAPSLEEASRPAVTEPAKPGGKPGESAQDVFDRNFGR